MCRPKLSCSAAFRRVEASLAFKAATRCVFRVLNPAPLCLTGDSRTAKIILHTTCRVALSPLRRPAGEITAEETQSLIGLNAESIDQERINVRGLLDLLRDGGSAAMSGRPLDVEQDGLWT